MAMLPGWGGQNRRLVTYRKDGSITEGGVSQLALAAMPSRSYLAIQTLHAISYLYVETGSARATASLTSGAVSSVTVTNGGFGFTYPPIVEFLGGGDGGAGGAFLGCGLPGYPAPGWSEGGGAPAIVGTRPAKAHCVLTGGIVTSIEVDDPGLGYIAAPYVQIVNDPRDPFGCADPYFNSVPSGVQLTPGGNNTWEASVCTTDPVAVWGPTTDQAFTLEFMP